MASLVDPASPLSPAVAKRPDTISAASILAALKAARIDYVITLPDITSSQSVLVAIEQDAGFRHIKVCKEDEAFGIASGLSYCDKRAVIMIQNTGLLVAMNALQLNGVEYGLPLCAIVGLLDKEPDSKPRDSEEHGVRIMEPILDTMGAAHCLIEREADAALIAPAIEDAYASSRPLMLLLGRRPKPLS